MRLTSIVNEAAYNAGGWVTPDGNYSFTDVHILDVLKYPEKFGLTRDFIDDTYTRHGEEKMVNGQMVEGNARDELILLVLKKGWVRFRRYRNYWSVNVYSWDRGTIAQLKGWVAVMVKSGNMGKYEELRVTDFKTETLHKVEADDILRNRVHEQTKDSHEKSV